MKNLESLDAQETTFAEEFLERVKSLGQEHAVVETVTGLHIEGALQISVHQPKWVV